MHLRLQRPPVDIEVVCELRRLSVLQHVLPPRVRAVSHAHVVRYDVEHQSHAGLSQVAHDSAELVFAADLGIDLIVVGDVVAVHATGAGLQDGRRVQMRDAKRVQVRDELARVLEPESAMKLQTVCRQRTGAALSRAVAVKTFPDCRLGREDPGLGHHAGKLDASSRYLRLNPSLL